MASFVKDDDSKGVIKQAIFSEKERMVDPINSER